MILCRCLCSPAHWDQIQCSQRPADVENITIGQRSQWEVLTQRKIFQSFIFMLLHWISFLFCISRMIVLKTKECPYFSIKPLAQEPLMPYSGEQTSWMLQSSMPKSRVAPGYMQRAGAFKQHHITGFFLKPQLKSSFWRKFHKLLHLNRNLIGP